jgi:hypothetical protein
MRALKKLPTPYESRKQECIDMKISSFNVRCHYLATEFLRNAKSQSSLPRSRSASKQKRAAGHLLLPNHIHNQACSFSSLLLADEPSAHVQRYAILLKPQTALHLKTQ